MSKVTKPPSTAPTTSTTTTTTSVQESEVTRYLYIKPSRNTNDRGKGMQSLEKEAVLRRIRHKKRVDRVRNALSSLVKAMPEPRMTKDGELVIDDAFSSP